MKNKYLVSVKKKSGFIFLSTRLLDAYTCDPSRFKLNGWSQQYLIDKAWHIWKSDRQFTFFFSICFREKRKFRRYSVTTALIIEESQAKKAEKDDKSSLGSFDPLGIFSAQMGLSSSSASGSKSRKQQEDKKLSYVKRQDQYLKKLQARNEFYKRLD